MPPQEVKRFITKITIQGGIGGLSFDRKEDFFKTSSLVRINPWD